MPQPDPNMPKPEGRQIIPVKGEPLGVVSNWPPALQAALARWGATQGKSPALTALDITGKPLYTLTYGEIRTALFNMRNERMFTLSCQQLQLFCKVQLVGTLRSKISELCYHIECSNLCVIWQLFDVSAILIIPSSLHLLSGKLWSRSVKLAYTLLNKLGTKNEQILKPGDRVRQKREAPASCNKCTVILAHSFSTV